MGFKKAWKLSIPAFLSQTAHTAFLSLLFLRGCLLISLTFSVTNTIPFMWRKEVVFTLPRSFSYIHKVITCALVVELIYQYLTVFLNHLLRQLNQSVVESHVIFWVACQHKDDNIKLIYINNKFNLIFLFLCVYKYI